MSQQPSPKVRLLRMLCDAAQRQEFRKSQFKVADVMSSDPATIEGTCSLRDAVGLFSSRHVRHVLITSRWKLVGILSDRDVLKALWKGREDLSQPIQSVATCNPETASQGALVGKVASMMLAGRYSAVPIVNGDGIPVGIVTSSDLIWLLKLSQLANYTDENLFLRHLAREVERLVATGKLTEAEGGELSKRLVVGAGV